MKLLSATLASLRLASAASASNKQKVSYDDWKVFRINGLSNDAKFQEVVNKLHLDVWKGSPSSGDIVDVSVAPEQLSVFEASTKDIETKCMHENLGASIADENSFSGYTAGAAPNATWFQSYHSLADHYQWITDLAAAYPLNSKVISAGKSFEGRDIRGIHIWGSGGKGSQKAVVWHSTVHAREWITTMVNEYAAYQLLTSTDAATAAFKNKYDFYIFPIVNPDGFYFSQNTDRLWRKNRQITPSVNCTGLDINRNWPHKSWNMTVGASTSPCASSYKGTAPGDGAETKALTAHLSRLSTGKGIQLYMDIHSYFQYWMYPYGYTCSDTLPNSASYISLTEGTIAAIEAVHGTNFTGGSICQFFNVVSGSSVDYVLDNAKAKYSMTVELRDTGTYGFVLPADQIIPSSEETWAGLAYLLENMD